MSRVMEVVAVPEIPENVQRWTAKRRAALVVSISKGETSVLEVARKHGLTVAEVERWKKAFLAGVDNALPFWRDTRRDSRQPP